MQQLKTAVQDGQNTWVPRQDSPFDENHFICSCSGPHFSPICGSSAALPFSFVCVCLCFWFVFAILSWNHCVSLRVLNSFDTFHQFQDRRATSTEPEEKKELRRKVKADPWEDTKKTFASHTVGYHARSVADRCDAGQLLVVQSGERPGGS